MNIYNLNSIFGVIVIYNQSFSECETIISICRALEKIDQYLNLYVYDNSPYPQFNDTYFTDLRFNITYVHNHNNPGISVAYENARKIAERSGYKWILLLDQDTKISLNFFETIFDLNRSNNEYADIVCIIPKVLDIETGSIISPCKMYTGGIVKPYEKQREGIISDPITGINSGTMLSLDFLNQLGGFNHNYPLDMLDHWCFREIHRAKKQILLLNVEIYQNLSVNSFYRDVSIRRYESILKGEDLFFEGFLERLIYKVRLVVRIFRHLFSRKFDYFKLALKYFI